MDDVSFAVNDAGEVVAIRDGERMNLGPAADVREAMVRFIAQLDLGEKQ